MFTAYVLLQTKFGKKGLVANKLNRFEEVSLIDEVYGRYDLIIKIEVQSSNDFEDFLENNLHSINEIQQSETLICSEKSSKDIDLEEE